MTATPGSGLSGCTWRRCAHPAVALVAFALPHPLAGTRRGYCRFHAEDVAAQLGASLAVAGGVAVQPAPPGLYPAGDGAAGTAGRGLPWAGGGR